MGGGWRPSPFSSGPGKIPPQPPGSPPPKRSLQEKSRAGLGLSRRGISSPPLGQRREPPRDQGPERGQALPHLQWSAGVALVWPSPPPRSPWGSGAHNGAAAPEGGRLWTCSAPGPAARPAAPRPGCVPYCPLRARHGTGRRFAFRPARPFPSRGRPAPGAGSRSLDPERRSRPPPSPTPLSLRPAGGGAALSDRAAIVTFPRRVGAQPSVHRRRWRGRRRLCVQTSGTEGK